MVRRKETTVCIYPAGYGAQLDENDVKRLSARNFSNKTTPVAESRLRRCRRRRRRPRGTTVRFDIDDKIPRKKKQLVIRFREETMVR